MPLNHICPLHHHTTQIRQVTTLPNKAIAAMDCNRVSNKVVAVDIKIIPCQVDIRHKDINVPEIEQMSNIHLSTITIGIIVGCVDMT